MPDLPTCVCCLITEGDEERDGVAVDEASGLCLYCQPCPHCARMGTNCKSEAGPGGCDPIPTAHETADGRVINIDGEIIHVHAPLDTGADRRAFADVVLAAKGLGAFTSDRARPAGVATEA